MTLFVIFNGLQKMDYLVVAQPIWLSKNFSSKDDLLFKSEDLLH